jgi:hypothetical protein
MGINVKRLETHQQYEEALKRISDIFNELYLNKKDRLNDEVEDILTKIKEKNINKQVDEEALKRISDIFNELYPKKNIRSDIFNELYQNKKIRLKDELEDILTKIKEKNINEQEYEETLKRIRLINSELKAKYDKYEIKDILTKIEEANMEKQDILNKNNINEKQMEKQDEIFEKIYAYMLKTLSSKNIMKG